MAGYALKSLEDLGALAQFFRRNQDLIFDGWSLEEACVGRKRQCQDDRTLFTEQARMDAGKHWLSGYKVRPASRGGVDLPGQQRSDRAWASRFSRWVEIYNCSTASQTSSAMAAIPTSTTTR